MRSKEVEVAIKILKNTNFEKYTYSCKKCSLEDYKNCYTENCHDKSKDTLLNYISELEKDTVSKSVIRDKIKELEEERNKVNDNGYSNFRIYKPDDRYNFLINILNKLLEGE